MKSGGVESLRDLGRDGIARIGLAALAFYLLLHALPIPRPWMEFFSRNVGEACILLLLLVALLHGRGRLGHAEERRFWGLLGACFGLWLVGIASYAASMFIDARLGLFVAVDSFFLLSFLCCFLAIDQKPHLPSGWSRGHLSYGFSTLGTLLFVFALILYFFIIPFIFQGGWTGEIIPTYFLIIALDALLAIRFFHARWGCRDPWWRRAYGLLGLASLLWLTTDTIECVNDWGYIELPYGTFLDFLWYAPFLLILFLARRRLAATARPATALPAESGSPDLRADSPLLLLIYAFLFPLFHGVLDAFDLLGAEGRLWRVSLVLFSLLAFVALAASQHRLLEKRTDALRSALTVLVSNEQMQQAQKMEAVGRLAGGVAHDFNNLLMIMQGNCSLLLEGARNPEDRKHRLEEIRSAVDRASWMTRELLAFSRSQVLEPQTLDLSVVVRDSRTMLRRLLGERIEVLTRLGGEPAMAEVDAGQMLQVILNLAVNARDAMPEGGRLTLEIDSVELDQPDTSVLPPAQPGRYVVLAATDTGCGMDRETRSRIFEPFYTCKQGGVGLGLATVYGIVVQSGGFIRVSSREGEGSTFRIYLPRVEAPAAARAADGEPRGAAIPGSSTVLLVEDDATVRMTIRELLDECGVEVLEAKSGEDALGVFNRHLAAIDLLLTDIVMPGMSGWQLGNRMKALGPEMKVLYMSGYSDPQPRKERTLGPNEAFLQKPFTLGELQGVLESLLGREQELAGSPRTGNHPAMR